MGAHFIIVTVGPYIGLTSN